MNRREAEELLPWFVAGTLPEDEHQAVKAFVDSGEISKAELEEVALFAETVSVRGADEPAFNPALIKNALDQLDGITQEPPEVPLVVGEVGANSGARGQIGNERPGLLARLLDSLQWSLTPPMARLAIAGQFALLLGIAVLVATTEAPTTDGAYETVSGSVGVLQADLSITFAPGIGEADARALLLERGLQIVAGPSALGIYQLAAPATADLGALANALVEDPRVIFAQPVPQP
ncbi:MAG: hypothetical protein AAGE43_08860 [Pseudomonadota bacterium]